MRKSARNIFVTRQPSFLEGVSRIVDIGGTLRDRYVVVHGSTIREAIRHLGIDQESSLESVDAKNLDSDWDNIAALLNQSMKQPFFALILCVFASLREIKIIPSISNANIANDLRVVTATLTTKYHLPSS